MEKEIDYNTGNRQMMTQIERKNESIQIESEEELADVVYIFTSPDKPGIKFYDRTPQKAEAAIVGTLPQGKFITDTSSIYTAQWDESINEENETVRIRVYDGAYKATTIMVSEEQFDEIIRKIVSQMKNDKIIIDTRKKTFENKRDYKSLLDLKQELITEINLSDYTNLNKKGSSGGSFGK